MIFVGRGFSPPLVSKYIRETVLYREALTMGLNWRLIPYSIGSLASFWTIERTLSFICYKYS